MSELHCPCRFRLPLKYNDGRDVEPEILATIFEALTRQFGGFTPLGTGEGDWHGQTEPTLGIEVAVLPHRVPELRELIYAIGKALGQKQMYFDVPAPSVEFLNIEEQDESSDGIS